MPANIGNFGTDYSERSVVALIALGANLPADAIYPRATTDSQGQPLNGASRYVVTFPKGQLPPVKGFWSLTMYNDKQAFVANPINRYAIGDRDRLRPNPDGSVTLYIQNARPGPALVSNLAARATMGLLQHHHATVLAPRGHPRWHVETAVDRAGYGRLISGRSIEQRWER